MCKTILLGPKLFFNKNKFWIKDEKTLEFLLQRGKIAQLNSKSKAKIDSWNQRKRFK
jgi:hypothetical protein